MPQQFAQIVLLRKFVEACKTLDSEGIYELFDKDEDDIRDIVFCYVEGVLDVVLADEMEPTRASMIALGLQFKVQSLIDY